MFYATEEQIKKCGCEDCRSIRRRRGQPMITLKQIPEDLLVDIDTEITRGIKKWGNTDRTPEILLSAALEELGEVAHAYNHDEGVIKIQKEIAEVIGVLVRLYKMVGDAK